MNIDIIFKIAGVGIIIAIVNQVLNKNGRDDVATIVTLVGVMLILMVVIEMIGEFFETLRTVFDYY